MKKIITFLAAAMLLAAVSGCGTDQKDAPVKSEPAKQEQTGGKASDGDKTDEKDGKSDGDNTDDKAGNTSTASNKGIVDNKYEVEILSARVVNDYQGNPAVIVTYNFTNKSNTNAAMISSVSAQAFQNSVQCSTAILMDSSYDAAASMSQVQPGGTLQVEYAYSLKDTANPVTVQVRPLFDLNNTVSAEMEFTLGE